MTKPAEQGLDRVSLSESNEPWSLFLSPVHSVSTRAPKNLTWSPLTQQTRAALLNLNLSPTTASAYYFDI